MDPITGVIGGVLGIGASLFGASSQNAAQRQARRAEQQRIDQQYKYDQQNYAYNWSEALRDYEFLTQGVNIQRQNQATVNAWQDATNQQQYGYQLQIRDYEYQNAFRLFQRSNEIAQRQVQFNAQAAQVAVASERRKLEEIYKGASFDQQDLFVSMMQELGLNEARGQSGVSQAKIGQSTMAQVGRNQAVIAESLVSADRQYRNSVAQIQTQQYGANLQAEASRLLPPSMLPAPPKPYAMPTTLFQDPKEPVQGPAPLKGVNTAPRPSSLGIVAAGLSGGANFINSGIQNNWWS
jgi:hypothetical protein